MREPEPEKEPSKEGEGKGKVSKELDEPTASVRTTSSESAGGPVAVAPAAPSAVTATAAPEAPFELSNGSLSRSLAAVRRREHAGQESGWLGVGAPTASGSPDGNVAATTTMVAMSLAVLGNHTGGLPAGGVARGSDGRSAEGHSSVPAPGPGPGGSGGGAAAGGGTASASSASLTLVSPLLLAPPGIMRRLFISGRSRREAFFALIQERPD